MAPRKKSRIVHTQAEVAVHFGVSNKSVQEWLSHGCPYVPRKKGKAGEYDIDAIDEWRREQKGLGESDPLLNGPDSPALEEYRKWKAKREKFNYYKDRKKWMPIETVVQGLAVFASTMRQSFDALQRQFGQEALAIVENAIDDAERIFSRAIGTEDVDIDSDDSLSDKPDIVTPSPDIETQADSTAVAARLPDDAAAEGEDAR